MWTRPAHCFAVSTAHTPTFDSVLLRCGSWLILWTNMSSVAILFSSLRTAQLTALHSWASTELHFAFLWREGSLVERHSTLKVSAQGSRNGCRKWILKSPMSLGSPVIVDYDKLALSYLKPPDRPNGSSYRERRKWNGFHHDAKTGGEGSKDGVVIINVYAILANFVKKKYLSKRWHGKFVFLLTSSSYFTELKLKDLKTGLELE